MKDSDPPPRRDENEAQYIPKDDQERGSNRTSLTTTAFSGPLPHPQLLREYEAILPGAAERIFAMTEALTAAQAKQTELTELAINKTAEDVKRSQWMAFGALVFSFAAVFTALLLDQPAVAGTIVSFTVVGLVGAFVGGRVIDAKLRPRPPSDDGDDGVAS